MSQIICEECGKAIETSNNRCPYCGCPIELMNIRQDYTACDTQTASDFTQEIVEVTEKHCAICGYVLSNDLVSCPICGWDGKNEYKTPFEDKENFDQQLFDSIQVPKKPPSASKAFIIASIPTLMLLPIAGFVALLFEPVAVLLYFIFRSNEKDWEWKTNNFEEYRISRYNFLKEQKDAREDMQKKIHRYESSTIKYIYPPYSIHSPMARFFVCSSSSEQVELILEDKTYIDIPFSEIIGSEILEDAEVRGGVGRAIVGGMIAGDAGAIVGASTAKKSVTSFTVRILSNNLKRPAYDIPLIKSEVKTDSQQYKEALAFANNVQASIKAIAYNLKTANASEKSTLRTDANNISKGVADEIMKFKELMDCGAITKEEFEAKKKQLLDL